MTMRAARLMLVLSALGTSVPAFANLVSETTFQQKTSQAEVVILAIVKAVHGRPGSNGSTATLAVSRILKGQSPKIIQVLTYSDIAELNPQCCEVGASYMMFLSRLPDGRFVSIRGNYGIIRIGARGSRLNRPDPRP